MRIQHLSGTSLLFLLAMTASAGVARADHEPKVTYASLCEKAESTMDDGQFNVALSLARRAIVLNPQGWKAYSIGARSDYYLDQAAEAESFMKKALAMAPVAARASLDDAMQAILALKSYKLHIISGNERKAQLQMDDAGREYAAAYRASPRHYQAALLAADMYRKANDTDNALEMLQSLADSKLVPESVHNQVRMLMDSTSQQASTSAAAGAASPATATKADDAAKQAEADRLAAEEKQKQEDQVKAAAEEAEKKRIADMEAKKKADVAAKALAKKVADKAARQKQIGMLRGDLADVKTQLTSAQADFDNAQQQLAQNQAKLTNDQGRLDSANQDMQRHFDNAANFDAQAASSTGALANFYRTQANIERLAANLAKVTASTDQDAVTQDNTNIQANQAASDSAQRKIDDLNAKVKDTQDRIDRLIAAG